MILGVGLDLCEISRMEDEALRERLMARCYTPEEAAYVRGRGQAAPDSAAGHFAAKEAALKALGTGLAGATLREVEVTHGESGAPILRLHGRALARAEAMGVQSAHLSITHTGGMAAAMIVLEG